MQPAEQLLIDSIEQQLGCVMQLCFLDAGISAEAAKQLSQLQQTKQATEQECSLQLVSNRYDVHKANPNIAFNDFNFASNSIASNVYLRIAKEKQINLHIIEQSFKRIHQGKLILIGYKNDGMPSLIKAIKKHYQCELTSRKFDKQLQLIECSINQPQSQQLSQPSYEKISHIEHNELSFYSKAGSFGWQKIDRGSALLMQAITTADINTEHSVLDLGCGYGYLSIKAHEKGWQHIDATDNCAAAILACQQNFTRLNIQGDVFASNCALGHNKQYDVVLCNPPFHQGFDHDKSLSALFIQQIAAKLKANGSAFVVVNQFIGLEKIAQPHFKQCQLLAKQEGFKLFKLQVPTNT